MRIIYNGDRSPVNVKIKNLLIGAWSRGDIRELDEWHAKKLLRDNKNFSEVGDKKLEDKKVAEEPKEKELEFDLDGDGDVDKDDYKIAGKVLAHARKMSKK